MKGRLGEDRRVHHLPNRGCVHHPQAYLSAGVQFLLGFHDTGTMNRITGLVIELGLYPPLLPGVGLAHSLKLSSLGWSFL